MSYKKKKLYSQILNSKTKNSMKNEIIKLNNVKYFSKKKSKNKKKLYTHMYLTLYTHKIYIELYVKK